MILQICRLHPPTCCYGAHNQLLLLVSSTVVKTLGGNLWKNINMHLLMFYMNTPIAYLNPGFRQNINYNSIICTKQFCLFFMRWKLWVILSLGCLEKAMTRTVTALLWFNNCLLGIASCTKHEKKEEVIMYPCHAICIQDTNFIDLQRKLLHESYSFMKAVDKCIENIGVSMSVYLVLENKIGNKWAF